MRRASLRECVRAGLIAAALSGAPSTVWELATGGEPMRATLAAGHLVAPRGQRRVTLFGAAAVAHLCLSVGWAVVLSRLLPRHAPLRRELALGAAAGAGIAAIDLGVAHAGGGARTSGIRALPVLPQLLDHLFYGATVAAVLARGARRTQTR